MKIRKKNKKGKKARKDDDDVLHGVQNEAPPKSSAPRAGERAFMRDLRATTSNGHDDDKEDEQPLSQCVAAKYIHAEAATA